VGGASGVEREEAALLAALLNRCAMVVDRARADVLRHGSEAESLSGVKDQIDDCFE
jgi:AhpD family alkylhydroperoxidase